MRGIKQDKLALFTAVVISPALLLGACAHDEVNELANAPLSGEAYPDSLARNYAEFAKFEYDQMYDTIDARHFAVKGMKALKGENVEPENPQNWSIEEDKTVNDVQSSRARLIDALTRGASQKAPAATARAMVSYDCWVEQLEEGWQTEHIERCRSQFRRALAVIDDNLKPSGKESVGVVENKTVVAAPDEPDLPANYLAFFDWDSAEVTPTARTVVETAVENARKIDLGTFEVVGHADTSGPADYNLQLSHRRADAIVDVLVEEGVDPRDIRVRARGESEPLVPTGDGVREPQNRRVRIGFVGYQVGA